MSKFCFNEKKATQLAAAFIERSGGVLNYMKLTKLMYMADRAALVGWARPITGDAYLAMKHGPVLGETYSMISDGQSPASDSYWFNYVERTGKYNVALLQPCPPSNLSEAERTIIDEIFERYGHYDKWELVDHLHEILPEWSHPGIGCFSISMRDILTAEGFSSDQATEVEEEMISLHEAKILLGCASSDSH
ncbi:MAG: Panacea domain-containing protein [Cyanobacteria bacterium J06581_3]